MTTHVIEVLQLRWPKDLVPGRHVGGQPLLNTIGCLGRHPILLEDICPLAGLLGDLQDV